MSQIPLIFNPTQRIHPSHPIQTCLFYLLSVSSSNPIQFNPCHFIFFQWTLLVGDSSLPLPSLHLHTFGLWLGQTMNLHLCRSSQERIIFRKGTLEHFHCSCKCLQTRQTLLDYNRLNRHWSGGRPDTPLQWIFITNVDNFWRGKARFPT